MSSLGRTGNWLRFAAGILAGMLLLALPVSIFSLAASAGDEHGETALRFYFAIPFIATQDRQPARLGFQLMYESDEAIAYSPLETRHNLDTALDMGFTRNGLAKLDVNGADARGAYEIFARAIGLTPDEVELCREIDCLDWVKQGDTALTPASRLGEN